MRNKEKPKRKISVKFATDIITVRSFHCITYSLFSQSQMKRSIPLSGLYAKYEATARRWIA